MANALYFTTREAITAYLETALKNISGMKKVDRQHYENFAEYDYPSAFLNEIRDTRRTHLLDIIEVKSLYTAIIFSKSETANLSTILNGLIQSGLTALLADQTCGGKAYSVDIQSVNTDEGFLAPHCAAIFMVEIMYLSTN